MTDLPEGWAQTTVGEVADIGLGRQRSPKNHTGDHMRPYLRSANVTWDGVDIRDVKEMNFDPGEAERFELQPGDLLLNEASGSPNEVGKPAIWKGQIPGCCFQNTLLRIQSRGPSTPYLYWYCYRSALLGEFGEAGRGVNIRHLGKAGLVNFPLPLPPLAEQGRIVAAIEEHFSHLDAAAVSVAAGRRRLNPLRRSVLAQANDTRFPEMSLDDLLDDIEAGKSYKSPGGQARHDQWGVIKVSAMTWGSFDEDEHKVVPDDVEVDPRYEVAPGDLLLSRANTSELVGASVLVDRTRPKLLLSDKSMRLHLRSGVDKGWMHAALSSPTVRRQMSAVATGTSDSMRNISQAKVRQLRVHVPPSGIQRQIAEQVRLQLSATERMAAQLDIVEQRHTSLRRSVLASAFSGELVAQDPRDESGAVLLERIRDATPARKSRRKSST